DCVRYGRMARTCGAAIFLVAVPPAMYREPVRVVPYYESIAAQVDLPLVVQDLDWNAGGLDLTYIVELAERIPSLVGLKIETVPAGPKYSAVRNALGERVYLAGGWAVTQMIEGLDRGIDAMMPECSMVPVYVQIDALYRSGNREAAVRLFRELLPVLAFTNQEIRIAIAFCKELLVRKGIFQSATMRGVPFPWDQHHRRIADELIEHYLAIESRMFYPMS